MYEFLVRGDPTDPNKWGAHVINLPGGSPVGVTVGALPAYLDRVNVATLARVAALEAELSAGAAELAALKTEYAAFKARATTGAVQARAIIADVTKSDAQSCVEIKGLVDEMLQSKDERELEAADKVIAEAIAARERLVRAI